MTKHLEREVESLKQELLKLSRLVLERLHDAVKAVMERNRDLAARVVRGDSEVDRLEVTIEEDCLKVLALYQPVAVDLRLVVSVLKMNNDLERIGDLAVNIAERADCLAQRTEPKDAYDFHPMVHEVTRMLRESLDSLVNLDLTLAKRVCTEDNTVDAMHRNAFTKIQASMHGHPHDMESYIDMLSVSRNLERVADHATNLAEDVIYMIEGEIVRHRGEVKAERIPHKH